MDSLIRLMLFNVIARYLATWFGHIKEAQIRFIFQDKKPTFLQILGVRRFKD